MRVGVTLLFSYIRRFVTIFWVQHSSKNEYFWGYEKIVDFIVGGHYNIGLFCWVISIRFRAFKVRIQNGNIFGTAKFQIFLGMPDILDSFLG